MRPFVTVEKLSLHGRLVISPINSFPDNGFLKSRLGGKLDMKIETEILSMCVSSLLFYNRYNVLKSKQDS